SAPRGCPSTGWRSPARCCSRRSTRTSPAACRSAPSEDRVPAADHSRPAPDQGEAAVPDVVWETALPGLPPPKRGKVRDVYDLGEQLLIVACDRLSAYDHVLRPGIPVKGKVLTQLSNFWFDRFTGVVPHHMVASDPVDFPAALRRHAELLKGRTVLVTKAKVVPFECVA